LEFNVPDIIGIRFKKAGKVYFFDPGGAELKALDYVVVQTARGTEMGQITIASKQVLASELTAELKPIMRKATEEDVKRALEFTARERTALVECTKIVTRLNLAMKLVSAEYNLDGGRLTFFFTAEARVDFRELVRELTSFFKTRIELRQIGPRDQAKIVGGLGRCGRALCCGSFLSEFNPVSIKMAKEQDLPLDPMKISGVCGRLQCCLAYEAAQYHDAKALLPRRGQSVTTTAGVGIVIGGNPLKETVLVELESKAEAEFPLAEIKYSREPSLRPPIQESPVDEPGLPAQPQISIVQAPDSLAENTSQPIVEPAVEISPLPGDSLKEAAPAPPDQPISPVPTPQNELPAKGPEALDKG
jgi:cell fate regulator YaaT (PSP1 superfamily)